MAVYLLYRQNHDENHKCALLRGKTMMLKVAIIMLIVVVFIAGIAIEKQLKQRQLMHMHNRRNLNKDIEDIENK